MRRIQLHFSGALIPRGGAPGDPHRVWTPT